MAARIACGYACILLGAEALLFVLSLILHSAVLVGAKGPFTSYDVALFRAAVIVGIPITAFLKNGFRWMQQIKSCPQWMWKTALAFGIYSVLIVCFYGFFSRSNPLKQPLSVSGVPLGFDAIWFCILYSALRSHYLSKSELTKAAGRSLLMVGFGLAMFLAYRAGYLPRPRTDY